MNNQTKKSTDKKNGAGVDHYITCVSPQRNTLQGFFTETQKKALKMGISQQEAKKSAESEKIFFVPE